MGIIQSRASWAALHQSSISSIYADASFQEWQYWHRALERAELRRRRKRTIDFIEESSYMANLFVDETYAKRAIEIHVEYGRFFEGGVITYKLIGKYTHAG